MNKGNGNKEKERKWENASRNKEGMGKEKLKRNEEGRITMNERGKRITKKKEWKERR
jgi:hypothetical protein